MSLLNYGLILVYWPGLWNRDELIFDKKLR